MSGPTRLASSWDLALLGEVDRRISSDLLSDVVSAERVMVVEVDGVAVGFLRWGLFWDRVPFMNLLWVLPEWRGQGVGTAWVDA